MSLVWTLFELQNLYLKRFTCLFRQFIVFDLKKIPLFVVSYFEKGQNADALSNFVRITSVKDF